MNPIDKLFGKEKKTLKKTKLQKSPKAKKSPPKIELTEEQKEDIELGKKIVAANKKDKRGLRPRELEFIKWYLLAMTHEDAAIKAGYSPKSASAIASQLLDRPTIKKEIKRRVKGIIARADDKIAKMIEHLYICAYYNPSEILDKNGFFVKPLKELAKEKLTYAISSIERRMTAKGHEYAIVKLADKEKARDQLGKYLQMFSDKLEITGGLTLDIGKPPEMVKPQEEDDLPMPPEDEN